MRRLAGAVALLAACALARPAGAAVEEFSTFDVLGPEMDDESVIDHFLARQPDEWRDAWERATTALRADQGCLTSASWYMDNEFRARSALGPHTWLDADYYERADLEASWEWLQFDVHRPIAGWGVPGFRVRPASDKSRQDFALMWDTPDSARALRVHAVFTFEDAFNSFWEFRQEQVGNRAEPYRSHPFEPALALDWRHARGRIEASGTWLTPSRKDIVDPDPSRSGRYALWGAKGRLRAEHRFAPVTVVASFEDIQARSAQEFASVPGDGRVVRLRWNAELALRRAFSSRLRGEVRYAYYVRAEDWRPPVSNASFHALDRVGFAELDWRTGQDCWLRAGLLYDRIGIAAGRVPGFTYGSRKESRGILGATARFDRVQVQFVEGVELDAEPYSVTFHHDKAFLHLMTTF